MLFGVRELYNYLDHILNHHFQVVEERNIKIFECLFKNIFDKKYVYMTRVKPLVIGKYGDHCCVMGYQLIMFILLTTFRNRILET